MPRVKSLPLNRLHWALLIAAAAAVVAVVRAYDVSGWLFAAMDWMRRERFWGPALFVLLYIADCMLFVPGPTLVFGAGIIFGVAKGSLLISLGSTLGAFFAFLIGRHLAAGWVERQLGRHARLELIRRAIVREGWKIVALTRLSPLFPFKALNYVYGTTRVSARDYLVGTWLGTLPGAITYVYLGSLIGNLFELRSSARFRPEFWPLYAGGFLVAVAVTFYTVRRARLAMQRVAQEEAPAAG